MGASSKDEELAIDALLKQVRSQSRRIYLANTIGESTNFKRSLNNNKPTRMSLTKLEVSMFNEAF